MPGADSGIQLLASQLSLDLNGFRVTRPADCELGECGEDGITVGAGSLVADDRVSNTGERGIRSTGSDTGFAHKVVTSSGQLVSSALCDDTFPAWCIED